jgi:hypothetical protein
MLKRSIITLLIIFACVDYSSAQTNKGVICGKIIDSDTNAPVAYASVAIKQDSTYTTGVISADDGNFAIQNVAFGDYTVEISFIGYTPHKTDISLNESVLDLGAIHLQPATTQLEEVFVVGTASKETASIEKTTINTARSMSAATGSILDVLRSSSSISVDNGGGVFHSRQQPHIDPDRRSADHHRRARLYSRIGIQKHRDYHKPRCEIRFGRHGRDYQHHNQA